MGERLREGRIDRVDRRGCGTDSEMRDSSGARTKTWRQEVS